MIIFLCNLVETKFYFEKYTIYFGVVSIVDLSRHYNKIKNIWRIIFKTGNLLPNIFQIYIFGKMAKVSPQKKTL